MIKSKPIIADLLKIAIAAQLAFHVSMVTPLEYMSVLYMGIIGIILFRFIPPIKITDTRYKKEQKKLTREANRIASRMNISSRIKVTIPQTEEGVEFIHTIKNKMIVVTPAVIERLYKDHYDALLGALAHEIGHISRKDGEGLTVYNCLAINAIAIIFAFIGYMQLDLLTAVQVVFFSTLTFFVAVQRLTRSIEFKADTIAAKLVGAEHIINVLRHLDYDFSILDYLFGSHPKSTHRIRKLKLYEQVSGN